MEKEIRQIPGRSARVALLACLVILAGPRVVGGNRASADWPQFRGVRHDGISDETGFRKDWSDPPPVVWERALGSAFSSFACVGNRVYTAAQEEGKQTVVCLDADRGDVIWKSPIEPEFKDEFGDGSRATPTVHDGRLYMLGAHGRLVCLDAESGRDLWSHSFQHKPQWGYSGSVLVDGDLAVSSGGGSDGALVAFDRKTGEFRWKTGDDPAGYATPYPFTLEGRRFIVGFTGKSALIVEAATGRSVLRIPWKTDWDVNAAAPIVSDGHLFLTSGYDTGCGLFKLRAEGTDLGAESVWKSRVLLNKFQSCVLAEGKLFTSDQKALVCIDFLTGKEHWRRSRMANGTLLTADGHLLVLTEKGGLQIGPISAEKFEPTTSVPILSGKCWTLPVLHRGRLYARNLERCVCLNLRG